MHNEWQSSSGYQVGDRITQRFKRHWLDIWWDRIRFMRWHVPAIEQRTFEAVSTAPGSIWPQVSFKALCHPDAGHDLKPEGIEGLDRP